jgi:glycosyltransferase involved in cell wall biosynthesis
LESSFSLKPVMRLLSEALQSVDCVSEMLTGHNLVYFAPGKWDDLWRNRQQLMSVFARQNRVLYVERQGHLRSTMDSFRRGNLGRPDLRGPYLRHVLDNLFVFRYPIWAPISGQSPLRELTRTIRRLSIQEALRKLGMSQPIVWFSLPCMVSLVHEMPRARLLLYHVVDEYTTYGGQTPARRRQMEEQEREMMALVDAVIVVSKKLYEAKHAMHLNTYLVPNGVDYQAYTAALDDPYVPDGLRAIRLPRLGYSGLIGDRIDLHMLKELAQENPAWSLVFLGEVRVVEQAETWQALLAMPNVHYLGSVEISQVPHYLKGFQVGLMPYMQNRHSKHISPLKLYDYLAAGLPVASLDIPAAREFGPYIHLADSPQDFARAVQAALADTSPERRQARRRIAAQHTWEARVEQLSDLIQAQLAARTPNRTSTRST